MRSLVPFVQFQKLESTHAGMLLLILKFTIPHGCFHMFFKLCKWHQIPQSITFVELQINPEYFLLALRTVNYIGYIPGVCNSSGIRSLDMINSNYPYVTKYLLGIVIVQIDCFIVNYFSFNYILLLLINYIFHVAVLRYFSPDNC